MLVATLCERFVKVTTPPLAVRLVVPCKVPLPAPRLAGTTLVLSLLRRFPYRSSIRTPGCCANAAPATAVGPGWVNIVKRFAAAALTTTLLDIEGVKRP